MSQVIGSDEEVQYVFNDMELILDSAEINTEGLSDIIYSDGTTAILVNENGEIIQGETQTVVLQDGDNLGQYYIKDEDGQILVADDQNTSVSQTLDETEVVQYIDEENTTNEPQIIYINEEGFTIQDPDLSEYQISEVHEDVNELPLKTIKLETEIVDLEELMQQQGDTAILENLNEENGYQYAVLKDGKLHIQSYTGDIFPVSSSDLVQEKEDIETGLTNEEILDLSKITGRNLLTGQTVTLHSYMNKLQKKIKYSNASIARVTCPEGNYTQKKRKKQGEGLSALLNKRLTLGKTTNGKRLIGKIIHVEKKECPQNKDNCEIQTQSVCKNISGENSIALTNVESRSIEENSTELSSDDVISKNCGELEQNNYDSEPSQEQLIDEPRAHVLELDALESNCDNKKIIIHEKFVSKECFDHISRTLSGLMNMDSVKKKLQSKNIIVKVVEKTYNSLTKKYSKKVSYGSGYMEVEYPLTDEGEISENWHFVPYQNSKEAIFGKSMDVEGEEESLKDGSQKYSETTNITLMITQGKANDQVIKVILSPTSSNKCSVCWREFHSYLQLRVHMNNVHNTSEGVKLCEICGEKFSSFSVLQEHRKEHVEEGELSRCQVDSCGKLFLTTAGLKRHSAVHNVALQLLECSVCLKRCSSESSLKKHLMTHMNVKLFYCETCGKNFSNPWDLNFHRRIHDPCKYYACEICKRTFSRHSNLLRHVEIHKGAGDLFQCGICGCSYHYMSSLTRHVVQNHIQRVGSVSSETANSETETS